jgi:hypothetical protein
MRRSRRSLKTKKASKETNNIAITKTKKSNTRPSTAKKQPDTNETIECKQGNDDGDAEFECEKPGPKTTAIQTTESVSIQMPRTLDITESCMASEPSCDDISDRYRNPTGGTPGETYVDYPIVLLTGPTTQESKRGENPTMPDLFQQDEDGDT